MNPLLQSLRNRVFHGIRKQLTVVELLHLMRLYANAIFGYQNRATSLKDVQGVPFQQSWLVELLYELVYVRSMELKFLANFDEYSELSSVGDRNDVIRTVAFDGSNPLTILRLS